MDERRIELSMDLSKAVSVWCALHRRIEAMEELAIMVPDENFAVLAKSEKQMLIEVTEDLQRQFEFIAPFEPDAA